MSQIEFFHYEAFTDTPGMGNPAGIVFDPEGMLAEEEMQRIAAAVGFNETAFVLPSGREECSLRLRFFAPGSEMPLCGHGTVAAVSALAARDGLRGNRRLVAETQAGALPVDWLGETREVVMKQNDAQFLPFFGNTGALLRTVGLTEADLDARYPAVYGSTGSWTLILPLKDLQACARCTPHNALFPSVLTEFPAASVHPVVLDVTRPGRSMHGRHFSGACAGTVEDPVTGTTSGVMGAYYLRYIEPSLMHADLLIEQGQEIGRDGVVRVWASREQDAISISIGGRAVCCGSRTVSY